MEGIHWKAKIRTAHTRLLARGEKGGERSDFVDLWEDLAQKNIPLWYLQLLGEPEKEGWLIKKGGIGGALTKRWFVLIGPLLFYFSSESANSRAKGVVPLHESEVVEYVVPEKEMQKYDKKSQKGGLKIGHCWAIRTRMREFVISSDTTEDRSAWIEACEKNSTLVIYDDGPEPKQSLATLRKLLLPTDAMRKELESTLGRRGTRGTTLNLPPDGEEPESPLQSPLTSPRGDDAVQEGEGGLLGGTWRYDGHRHTLKSYALLTDGSWPFAGEEQGLLIDVQYSWSDGELRPLVGSGSRGEWDGQLFRFFCHPAGKSRLVCEYAWAEAGRRFEPVGNTNLPIWVVDSDVMRNFNGVNAREFPDVAIDGSVPAIIALVVALHKFQWKCEQQWSK